MKLVWEVVISFKKLFVSVWLLFCLLVRLSLVCSWVSIWLVKWLWKVLMVWSSCFVEVLVFSLVLIGSSGSRVWVSVCRF